MGLHEWSYSNDYNPAKRAKMKHVDLVERFKQLNIEVELGFDRRADRARGRALPELRRADGLHRQAVHRVRRLHRRLPAAVPHHHAGRRGEPTLRKRLTAPALNPSQDVFVSGRAAADRARDGQGRGRLRALRPVRRALPDGAPGTWRSSSSSSPTQVTKHVVQQDGSNVIQVERVNDFAFKLANVNGTGSASANGLLMQAIFRMGIPVSGKNLFPSNIQGLPTWYEIRVNKNGHTARAPDYDLIVAMNAETYARDIKEVRSGGYLLYDSTWPLDDELRARRRHVPRRAARQDVQRDLQRRRASGS